MLTLWMAACVGETRDPAPVTVTGAEGPRGTTGPRGAKGDPGGAYRWHDAEGTPVTQGPSLEVFHTDLLWQVNAESAQLEVGLIYDQYFDDTNCQGEAYVDPFPPRFVQNITYVFGPPALYVRPDDLLAATVEVNSHQGFYCAPYAQTQFRWVLPVSALTEVLEVPAPGWLPPLHPEPL